MTASPAPLSPPRSQDSLNPSFRSRGKMFRKYKIIGDPIHGHMEFQEELIRVIDTEYFQRLRELKQLGSAEWVFPGAVHNRFCHSLGVAYLAGKVINHLKARHPRLEITDRECMLVQLAGLCHDLGHGPFSHGFEHVVQIALDEERERVSEEERARMPETWSHEDASELLFVESVKQADLDLTPDEITFVKQMIRGIPKGSKEQRGRHLFYFQIVANKQTGMDVDKYDYLLRDAYHTGSKVAFDMSRLLRPTVRRDCDGELVLAYYRKEEWMIHQLFRSRFDMHHQVYGHSVVIAFQLMFQDVLLEARDWLRITQAIHDPRLYLHLTDNVIHRIECLDPENPPDGFTKESLQRAQHLIYRIKRRQLYTSILQDFPLPLGRSAREANLVLDRDRKTATEQLLEKLLKAEPRLSAHLADFILVIGDRDFTRRAENPLLVVPFHENRDADFDAEEGAYYIDERELKNTAQPGAFWERYVRVYVRRRDMDINAYIERALNVLKLNVPESPRPLRRQKSWLPDERGNVELPPTLSQNEAMKKVEEGDDAEEEIVVPPSADAARKRPAEDNAEGNTKPAKAPRSAASRSLVFSEGTPNATPP